ncbi:DUF1579 family protein [Massilia cavernae]|uniref:DUF1579 domain-containing protein n=1 Tax=Massilia cavernae TaxID=2320864 RepID=A0A418Y8M6_9BURK|nr:DUF1579 family protein [Massilia cavernae]RJG27659.1 DUF1579 domain-containing protein [Massilia cavernae]
MDKETVTEQHRWLQQLVGNWTYEATAQMPDGPSEALTGTDHVRALGNFWIVAEGEGKMPGEGSAQMVLTIGGIYPRALNQKE